MEFTCPEAFVEEPQAFCGDGSAFSGLGLVSPFSTSETYYDHSFKDNLEDIFQSGHTTHEYYNKDYEDKEDSILEPSAQYAHGKADQMYEAIDFVPEHSHGPNFLFSSSNKERCPAQIEQLQLGYQNQPRADQQPRTSQSDQATNTLQQPKVRQSPISENSMEPSINIIGYISSNYKPGGDKYCCNHPICHGVTFNRRQELKRHHKMRHLKPKPEHYCRYPRCNRNIHKKNPFQRHDKLMEHIRKVHESNDDEK